MNNSANSKSDGSEKRNDSAEASALPRLDLYLHEFCPYCHTVLDLIEEMGQKDSVVVHDILADPKEMETLIKVAGRKQVPCLFVDGKPMHESGDIRSFLLKLFSGED